MNSDTTEYSALTAEHPRVREILTAGTRQGELTYRALNQMLGDLDVDDNDVEALIDMLEKRGVSLTEAPAADRPPKSSSAPLPASENNGQAKSTPRPSAHDDLDDVLTALRNLEAEAGLEEDDSAQDDPDEIQAEDAFRQYMNRMGQVPLLSEEEERRLVLQMQNGTPDEQTEAKQKLTEANLRLVVSVARAYVGRTSLSFLDIMQEGNIGLMRAIERYDLSKHKRLASYATWWIRRSIGKALANDARSMRLPGHLYETVQKINRVRRELEQDLKRPPTRQELAETSGLTTSQIDEALRTVARPLSLESPIGDQEDNELGEAVTDENEETPADAQSRSELRSRLEEVLQALPEREQAILMKRFGLGNYEVSGPQTHEDIADEMNLSRDRVRQLETRALRKLRRSAQDSGLDMFFGLDD